MSDPTLPSFAFAGTVTRKEFARIQSKLLPLWARWYVLYPALGAIFLACSLPRARVSELVMDLLIMAMLCVAMAFVTRRAGTRAWRQAVALLGRVHGVASAAGIEWNTERTTARHAWENVVKVDQAAGLTLVFFGPRSAFFFPRSFFESDAAWVAFNDAIARYAAR